LYKLSRLVEELTGTAVPVNKPLVGKNSFTHESGIHVDGLLKHPDTYEFVKPEIVGRKRKFRFGKHVGSKGLKVILDDLNIKTTEEEFKEILTKVKEFGDKGKMVTDADLYAIIESVKGIRHKQAIEIIDLVAVSGNKIRATASTVAKVYGVEKINAGTGVGPVDAAINSIRNLLGAKYISLEEYHVDAISGGTDATVNVVVKLKGKDRVVTARGVHTDIVMASVIAMVNGVNCLLSENMIRNERT
jgi:D-citramalate synthase